MESVAYVQIDEKSLRERWKEVKEDFWEDLKRETLRALKRLLETSMQIQVQDLVGSARWKHQARRETYRNGSYGRGLLTGLGYIAEVRVPRVRSGQLSFKLLQRYKQRSADVDAMVIEMFLAGVSTRRVQEVLAPLMGEHAVSAGTVSNLTKALDRMVFKFHNRKLSDAYRYLILDGIYLRAKSPVHAKRRCVLVAYGIKADGQRELMDFMLTKKGESQAAWEQFLGRLYYRGLEGKTLALVVMDGNQGVENAVALVYPQAKVQRCWAHKLRNVANACPKKLQAEVLRGARKIYLAESRWKAVQAFQRWEERWREGVPKAVQCLERDLEDLLQFYTVPQAYWKKLRTTNSIERTFREVRRRTRPMSCFQNRESVERIIFAIFYRLNKIWGEENAKAA